MLNSRLFLHIPHSSLEYTEEFEKREKLYKDSKDIDNFNKRMTDLYVDELFSCEGFDTMKAKFSRICCDVEKYKEDSKEIMSKYGQGVVYTRTEKGIVFISHKEIEKYIKDIIEKYYDTYHCALTKRVNNKLSEQDVLLVDCHSFYSDIVILPENKMEKYPDICVGFNEDETKDKNAIDFTLKYFKEKGYSVECNKPYSGSMIPNNLNTSKHKFKSIMIEVNRDLYLNGFEKNENFEKVRQDILTYLLILEQLH